MPYEHESGGTPTKPPAWTQHPLVSDLAWLALSGLMLLTLARNDGPRWLIAVYAVFLMALVLVAVRREVGRRRNRSSQS